MLNLVGKNLPVTTSVTVLKKMGHIEGCERIQQFFDNIIARAEPHMNDEQKSQIKEYQSYVANSVFLPIVVNNMIVHNMNFSDAMEASKTEFSTTALQVGAILGMINIIPGASKMFESVVGEIIDALSGGSKEEIANQNEFSCTIKEVSTEFFVGLAKLGILDIAEEISKMEKISTAIKVNMIDPVVNAAIKCALAEEKISEDELDEDDKLEIELTVKAASSEIVNTLPIQIIFSTVLTKAIEDDITMAKAMATFDSEQLIESAIEKIIFGNSLVKYTEQLEKVISIAYRLA